MNDYKKEILKLNNGEHIVINESDYGHVEIWKIYDVYLLFEVANYGGTPQFYKSYYSVEVDKMIKDFESWT